jgi:hypothetical protein
MDSKGNYTDRRGKLIRVGSPVQVAEDYDYPGPPGTGVVISLPDANSEHYGWIRVRMHGDGKPYYFPDNALYRIGADPGSPVALLEDAVETTRASNAAKLRLIEGLGGEPATTAEQP